MTMHAPTWMFEPVATLSPEQWQQWHTRVQVESDIDALLCDPIRSMIITTYPGCGITTSLYLLRFTDLLVFPYNPEQWPGQAQAFTAAESHFGQWMAHVAYALTEEVRNQPERIAALNLYQHQFIVWLLQRYIGRRQSLVWQSHLQSVLPSDAWERLTAMIANEPIAYEDTVADLKYQLHECVDVAHSLGWRGIFATIDITWWDWVERSVDERQRFDEQVQQLLTTLAPLEVPNFGVKLGIPGRLVPPQEIDKLTRSRIKPTIYPLTYRWNIEQLHQICTGLLDMIREEVGGSLSAPPVSMWEWLAPDIASIWETPGPGAAVRLAQQWLIHATQQTAEEMLLPELRAGLYRRAAPLRLDRSPDSKTVWRGGTAIQLDDMPFRVFQILWQHRGSPASNESLLRVAGTKANLDKIISRLREQLEPLYKSGTFIYLQRRQSSGTWLEKDICLFT